MVSLLPAVLSPQQEMILPPIVMYDSHIKIGLISSRTVKKVRFSVLKRLKELGNPSEFILNIDSRGGDAYAILALVDMIEQLKASGKTVITYCSSRAFSAASLLLCCGSKRIASPLSTVMLHSVQVCPGEGRFSDVEIEMKEAKRLEGIIFDLYEKYTGNTKSSLLRKLKKTPELYLSASESKDLNLIDEIATLPLEPLA